jgi:predicted DNA-binding transcriptional regulator AlpA
VRQSEPRTFGSGWISGIASIVLGAMAFGAVLCLLFPAQLTTPELREIYPMDLVRALLAKRIDKSRSWLEANLDSLPEPFRVGGERRWSEREIEQWIARRPRWSEQ